MYCLYSYNKSYKNSLISVMQFDGDGQEDSSQPSSVAPYP